jgi:O-antigen ligase
VKHFAVVFYTLIIGTAWFFIPHPLVVIAGGIAPVIVIQVFKYPFIMVLFFIIFSFFRIHEVFPMLGPLRIPSLLALASLSVLGYHLFIIKDIEIYWSRQLTWLATFFGLVVFGMIFATNRGGAIGYFTGIYIKIGIMSLAIAWLTRIPKNFLLASRLFSLSGILVAVVAMSNKAKGIGLVEGTRVTIGRDIGSVLGDPNDLSLVLLFPGSFTLSLALTKGLGKLERFAAAAGFITIISGIIATQSRGGLLGIMTISGFYAWNNFKSKFLLVGGAAVLAPILLVVAGISNRKSGGAHEEGIDESSMGRIYAWEAALHMALANPLTGVGLNNFYDNYYAYSKHWDGMNHAVHSTWMGIAGETGFLGLGVFITILVTTILGLRRVLAQVRAIADMKSPEGETLHFIVKPYTYALMAGFASFCISGTFLTQGFTWPVYILIALSVGLIKYADEQSDVRGIKIL